jgi:hypothetical protein
MQQFKETYVRTIWAMAAIGLATVAYLLLLTWSIAEAAISQTALWWLSLFPSIKAATLSWLWLTHLVAVTLSTLPIALAIRLYFIKHRLWAALCVSVLVFLTLLPAFDFSVTQAPYVTIWTIWEQVLLISALPIVVWIMEVAVQRRDG